MERSAKIDSNGKLISRDLLIKDLYRVIENFNCRDAEILNHLLSDDYKFYQDTISTIRKTSRSDIIISFGNNNKFAKVFIKDIIAKNTDLSANCRQINFNSFIHSTEDVVLKKICQNLGIDTMKPGFDGYRKSIEDYYKEIAEKKSQNRNNSSEEEEMFVVIFFDNMDQLFIKKKQILIYTLLEIVNISSNILFCGTAECSNLIDSMEKRNRSRFSQKTSFIRIKNSKRIYETLAKLFHENTSIQFTEVSRSSMQIFFELLMTSSDSSSKKKNEEKFVEMIDNYINLGKGVNEILTKIKYMICLITLKLTHNEDRVAINTKEKLSEIILSVLIELEDEELNGAYFTLLKNFPKLHITLLICLVRCVGKYKIKISIGMIYQEYSDFVCPKFQQSGSHKVKLDMVVVKKALEELANSNLITISHDDRLLNTYELKQPLEVTQSLLFKLDQMNLGNFDSDLKSYLSVNFT